MSDLLDILEDSDAEQQFNAAAKHLEKVVGDLDQATLLEFYAFYKQATVGPCNVPKPGLFALQAKAKWNAWNDLKQMSKTDAMEKYIQKLTAINPKWNDEVKGNGKKETWVSVSRPQIEEDATELADADKTSFDHVKEGNVSMLVLQLSGNDRINDRDEQGMGLLHWAADRGNAQVLEILLNYGADVNAVDEDGQTALHYAASVGYVDCVKLLIKFGADRTIKDCNGQTCGDVAVDDGGDTNISELLR